MLMRSQRRHRARLVEGMELDDLAALPASKGDEVVGGDAALVVNERDARVRTALAELPDDYRDVVVAHYHLDLGLQEIAQRFDLTESAVRSRLHRARARLRALLESTEVGADFRESTAVPTTLAPPRESVRQASM